MILHFKGHVYSDQIKKKQKIQFRARHVEMGLIHRKLSWKFYPQLHIQRKWEVGPYQRHYVSYFKEDAEET